MTSSLLSFPKLPLELSLWSDRSMLCNWQLSNWISGSSAANLSWDQANPKSSSFCSSVHKSRIWFRCFVWTYIGKQCPEMISLSNNSHELRITSWWLLWTKKFPQERMNEFAVEKVPHRVAFKVFSSVLKTWSWREQWYHGNLWSFRSFLQDC